MMLLRGRLEDLVRTLRVENSVVARRCIALSQENLQLRGQVHEMEQTLGRMSDRG